MTATLAPLAAAFLAFLWAWVWYAYTMYREEHERRVASERRLVPVLEIRGVGQTHGYHRITVHNLSSGRVRFRARLVEVRPPNAVTYPLSVPLWPTHGEPRDEAEVPGGGDQSIEVFVDPGPPQPLELLLMGNPPCKYQVPRGSRYELRICVYPAADGAVSVHRWFYIVPQPGGGVIFTPGGSSEAVSPAAPAAG